jgi:uncharacterized membrane protein
MWILDAIVQWLHISSAVLIIGGLFFSAYIMTPALRNLGGIDVPTLTTAAMLRFRVVVWLGIGTLLLSGVYNLIRALAEGKFEDPIYQHSLEAKVLLALVLFSTGIGLTVPLPAFSFFASRRRFFVTFNIHLGLLIVLLSAILRRSIN